MTADQLKQIFTHHAPNGEQVQKYQALRDKAHEFATLVNDLCPESREKSLAITNIQYAVMTANASIAIHS